MGKKFSQNGDVVSFEYVKFQPDSDDQLIYVWDIDKTYLDTKFETFRGLIKTAFEKAFQKVNVPGSASLIRALESTMGKGQKVPIYFISASPPQIEAKIFQKMRIDGLNPFGIFFKDNLKNFRPRKFKRLKQQVGFKIQALMELRALLKRPAKMVLFGDDSESDAVVYSLFSDICKRRITAPEINSILEALHVLPEQRARIMQLQSNSEINDPVDKIYINLVADTDPDYYSKFGRRVLATFTTFQAALDLYQDGRIDENSCLMVARDMISNYGFSPEELAKSFEDLHKRGFLKADGQSKILPYLKEAGLIPRYFAPSFRPAKALQKIGEKILGIEKEDPWIVENIDYLNDFR
jgi:uncharacterized protein DUF2183